MRVASTLLSVNALLLVIFKQSEAECNFSGMTFMCMNEEQKSILYQYNMKNAEKSNNITAIEIKNSSLPKIGNLFNSLDVEVMKEVNTIKLNQCGIKDIPENTLSKCENLELIDLSGNELESMSFLETMPKSLKEIYLSNNKIQEVPDIFSQLESLQIIDISNCDIRKLDFTVFKGNMKLNLINASHNNITDSVSQEYLKNIKCIDLSYNSLLKYDNIPSYCLDFSDTKMKGYQWFNISSRNKTVFIDTFFFSNNGHLRLIALNKNNDTVPIEIRYLNISSFRGNIPPDLDLEQVKVRKELILRDSNIASLEKSSCDFKPLFYDEGTNATFDLSSCSISDISALYFENYNMGRLNLCHNKFKILTNNVFKNAYIIQLDLCNSTIETIDDNAFDGLHTHTLNLSMNSINELDFLKKIRDIYVLDLSHNDLKTIASDIFSNLRNIKILDLSYNLIDTIGPKSLNRDMIEIVYLNNNKLKTIRSGMFENIPNLREVYLQQNPASLVEADAFKSLPNLRIIQLGKTEISVIQPYAFNNLQNLEILYLNDNRLTDIPIRIFMNVPNLNQLDLSGNSLNRVDGLRGLNLSTLRITMDDRFQYDKFYMPTLEYMYIIDSKPQNFQNLYNLKELYFVNSPIAAIQPQTFSGYFNVKLLNEQDIFSDIKVIPQYIFKDMRSLTNLNLTALIVKIIEPKAFVGLQGLENLSVAKNYIIRLDDYTFSGLDNLKSLDVSQNRISVIGVRAFDSLKRVESLRLNNNDISVIPIATFQDLSSLSQLGLGYNRIENLGVGIFSNLINLKSLDLSNNRLQRISNGDLISLESLEQLNLESNYISRLGDAATSVYLPRLKLLGINKNNWDCDNLKMIVRELERRNISMLPVDQQSSFYISGISCGNICNT